VEAGSGAGPASDPSDPAASHLVREQAVDGVDCFVGRRLDNTFGLDGRGNVVDEEDQTADAH